MGIDIWTVIKSALELEERIKYYDDCNSSKLEPAIFDKLNEVLRMLAVEATK